MSRVVLMAGTRKGAFFLESTPDRTDWTVRGPRLKGWEVSDLLLDDRGFGTSGGDDRAGGDSAGGTHPPLFAAIGHFVYGPAIHRSTDFGESWEQVPSGPSYGDGGGGADGDGGESGHGGAGDAGNDADGGDVGDTDAGRELNQIWTVVPGRPDEPDVLYAGVDEAGLFVSRDGGDHWAEVTGLADHETRPNWFPGKGGLCCHSVVLDPDDPDRMWVGISAVGVFRTDDGGATWTLCNDGLEVVVADDDHAHLGSCVHRLVGDPADPDRLFQQNHVGVYRTTNGADSWERVDDDLPSSFGFPMVVHPRDSDTLYTVPLESDEARMAGDGRPAVYRTVDAGDSWERRADGLPDDSWVTVLRQAMATDPLDPAGVYVGTTGGQVFYSADAGDTWATMDCNLPRIYSLSAVVVE